MIDYFSHFLDIFKIYEIFSYFVHHSRFVALKLSFCNLWFLNMFCDFIRVKKILSKMLNLIKWWKIALERKIATVDVDNYRKRTILKLKIFETIKDIFNINMLKYIFGISYLNISNSFEIKDKFYFTFIWNPIFNW